MQIIDNLTSIFTLTIVTYCRSLFVDVTRTYAEVQRTSAHPQRNFFRRYFSLKQNKATFAGDKTLQIVCPSLKMAGIFLKGSIKVSPVFKWQAKGSIKSQMFCYLIIYFFTDCTLMEF